MTKIEAYKTNLGLFVRVINGRYISPNVKVNGIPGDKFREIRIQPNSYTTNAWVFLEGIDEISSYEYLKPGSDILTGFILKIASIANDEIPLELSIDQVAPYTDDDGDYRWRNYSDLQQLYKPLHVKSEDTWQQEEIEVIVLRALTIDSYESPIQMKVTRDFTSTWTDKPSEVDLSSIVVYEDIERLLTPEFLLHERPCVLTSGQVYGIVRHHIKTNINSRYARVTSDYDFCFTVKRKIAVKPITTRTEIKNARGRSFARPKFKTTTTDFREVEIFEMTPADKRYSGYTPIAGWQANNLQEMKEQIEAYLKELMEEINRPVQECPHCNGTGHLLDGKIQTNDRE